MGSLGVIAADCLSRQVMAASPVGDSLFRHGFKPVYESLPLVILTDEEYGQLPLSRQVQRLVEDAFAGGAISEKYHDNAPFSAPGLHRVSWITHRRQ